jgi:hypothetical protein
MTDDDDYCAERAMAQAVRWNNGQPATNTLRTGALDPAFDRAGPDQDIGMKACIPPGRVRIRPSPLSEFVCDDQPELPHGRLVSDILYVM